MAARFAVRGLLLLMLAGYLPGCGYFQGNSADLEDEFADLELEEDAEREEERPAKLSKSGRLRKLKAADKEEDADSESVLLTKSDDDGPDLEPVQGELGLRLVVGDRFPLQKTVEQRLSQPESPGGSSGHSQLDLLLSLTVEELRDGGTRFGVRYHKVRYLEQDPEGRRIEFNSTAPPREVPAPARVYAGLVNNGFSFWIGPDNQVKDLVGFPDFLQRCVRDVPVAQRQAVIAQLTANKGENGISSFIDDSIGLLPVSTDPQSSRVAVREGTSWKLPVRRIDGPVPMQIDTQCKIKGLSERTAEIDLFGSVTPMSQIEQADGWKVSVVGGRCQGSCIVDRTTGLPTSSRVERVIDILMALPDGSQLKQRKEIVTTIQAFLNQEEHSNGVRPALHAESDAGGIESAVGERTSRTPGKERPIFR